jgi:hypothetical protein
MKKEILFIALLLLCGKSFSQTPPPYEVPDYETIKKDIENKPSNFYYPKLMERLSATDTLLTKDDFRHLYFGYFFQPKYSAYWTSADEKELSKYYSADTIQAKDYDDIIRLAKHSISQFPFDLRQMNFLAYIYHMKGDEVLSKKTNIIFQGILNAILSSGDGLKCESGFHVLTVAHEYVLLNFFELESVSQALTGNCDYLAFEKDKYKVAGLYFNIQKMLENEAKQPGGK